MDDALRAAYQRSLEDRSALNAECPAPEVLLAVGTGTLPEAERLAILNHLVFGKRSFVEMFRSVGSHSQFEPGFAFADRVGELVVSHILLQRKPGGATH